VFNDLYTALFPLRNLRIEVARDTRLATEGDTKIPDVDQAHLETVFAFLALLATLQATYRTNQCYGRERRLSINTTLRQERG
jgi:hypothetical protein